jgi:diguanylate cyclase (GGDEF)-like protein
MSIGSQEDRLRTLEKTRLLDSAPEAGFDRLTRLAARLLGAPVALVSLIDDRRQFFKSALGLREPWASRRETPLSHSFCQYVTRDRVPLVVSDAREHPELRDNLAIHDLSAIAYAGVPLFVDGQAIGAFCVIDGKPREWLPVEVALLEDLAASVVSEIELRTALLEARETRALTEAIVESLGDACVAVDPQRRFIVVNQAARRIFAGAEVGGSVPQGWSALHRSQRPDGSPMPFEAEPLGRGLRDQETNETFTLQRPGAAEPEWVEASGRPVRNGDGQVVGAVAVYRDVTERKKQRDVYRAIVQNLPNGAIFMIDRDLRYVSADGPLLPDLLRRRDLKDLIGRSVAEVSSPANREALLAQYRRALAGEPSDSEIEREGRYFDLRVVPISTGDQITHALISTYDVTDRRREALEAHQARDSLARERILFETTLAHIQDGVALIDSQSQILLANHAFAAMLNLPLDQVVGLTRQGFVQAVTPLLARPQGFAEALTAQAENATLEFEFARPRRRILTRNWTGVVLVGRAGILVTWHDVTAERDLLREREQLLLVDVLTGIPNRRAGETALRAEHQRMRRNGTPMCVAFLDIDHFKQVNDVFGHATGDDVLRMVAGTLAGEARMTDSVVRWGGEEFLAVLNVPIEGARVFCERARLVVEKLRCPPVERVTISAGIAQVVSGESVADAIERADRSLYDAKKSGRNRVCS